MSAPEHITLDRLGAVATITIDRPKKRNALALQTIDEICAAVDVSVADPDTRVIVLTGNGDRAFASGADLDEVSDAMSSPERARAYDDRVAALYGALAQASVPVIARMQASAIGGGYLLALACDLRICAPKARIAVPASRIGLMLSPLEHKLLVRQVGASRAKVLMFTGRRMDADQALAWGLVDMVSDEGGLDALVSDVAGEIAEGAPLSCKAAKRLIDMNNDDELAAESYREIYGSRDLREGLAAFAEKRPPRFEGR